MKKAIIAIGTALALTACGSDESGTFETDSGEGSYTVDRDGDDVNIQASSDEGEFSLTTGDDLDVAMPEGFSVYPGATVVSNMTVDQEDGGGGSVVTLQSDASVDELLAFYRAEASGAGIEIKSELDVRGMQIIAGEDSEGASFTFRAGEGDNGGTAATLMVGQ